MNKVCTSRWKRITECFETASFSHFLSWSIDDIWPSLVFLVILFHLSCLPWQLMFSIGWWDGVGWSGRGLFKAIGVGREHILAPLLLVAKDTIFFLGDDLGHVLFA